MMMWSVPGRQLEVSRFEPFEPVTVLYEFDGPRTFTVVDQDGELYLAHWCDDDEHRSRYLVVPTDSHLLKRLQGGHLTVLEALRQPRLWVVEVSSEGVEATWRTDLRDLPEDVLPARGTMLLPSLEPFLSVRAIGQQIHSGSVPASVIRTLVDGVQKALKQLLEGFLSPTSSQGRPPEGIRRLYDLPAQHFAFNSFQIDFRRPARAGQADMFDGTDLDPNREEDVVLNQVADQLYGALESVTRPSQGAAGETPIGLAPTSRRVLEALLSLTPPGDGPISEVEVGGTFAGGRNVRPYRLTRQSRQDVKRQLSLMPQGQVRHLKLTGRVRSLDLDRLTFELRDTPEGSSNQRFVCDEELLDDVHEAFNSASEVTVMGIQPSDCLTATLLAISPQSTVTD